MTFYVLQQAWPGTREYDRGGLRVLSKPGHEPGSAPRCPGCGSFVGLLEWLPPYRVELETFGVEYGDIVRTGDDFVVSDRFLAMYCDAGLEGLSPFEPVEVVRVIHHCGRPAEPLPNYFKTDIPYSQTTVDQKASGFVWTNTTPLCPVCLYNNRLRSCRRLIIEPGTWTGEDVFFPRGGTRIVVTERFKNVFERDRLRNAEFFLAEEFSYDEFRPRK
jgi:hypothetical protein